jgi:hypothetical protein
MIVLRRKLQRNIAKVSPIIRRAMGSNAPTPIKPANRISGNRSDVWYAQISLLHGKLYLLEISGRKAYKYRGLRSIINSAISCSPIQPVINMGQGSLYILLVPELTEQSDFTVLGINRLMGTATATTTPQTLSSTQREKHSRA